MAVKESDNNFKEGDVVKLKSSPTNTRLVISTISSGEATCYYDDLSGVIHKIIIPLVCLTI